jgi:hypothetical protein
MKYKFKIRVYAMILNSQTAIAKEKDEGKAMLKV